MGKRLLGYGYTDSNGIAKLDFDGNDQPISSHGYVGTGAGLVNVLSEVSLDERRFQSEIYSIDDTLWYDLATDNTKESSWDFNSSYISVSYDEDGRTVKQIDDSSNWRYFFFNDSTMSSTRVGGKYTIPTGTIIEFDVTAITGSVIFEMRDDNSNANTNYGATATGHYKIVLNGTDFKIYKDNATTPFGTGTMNGSNVRFAYIFNVLNESITYKNFKVYSY